MDLFIESLEGGRYLVASGNAEQRSLVVDQQHRAKTFHSLGQIREQFADQAIDRVMLKQSTPYDEMCGLESSHGPDEVELNWR